MAHLQLGTASITTSRERDKLAALRGRYLEIGLQHQSQFDSRFSEFKTADDLFQRFPDELERTLTETVNMVATDVAAHRVYDMDIATIRSDLQERLETVRDDFDRVQDRYFDILGKAVELDAQRQEAMGNRGHIIGGGFGAEGAVRGIAVAAVANAAIGLTYGLANLTAKAASALGDGKKKRELLADPDTQSVLGDFLCTAVLQGTELVASTVNASAGSTVFDVVSNDARQKSAAMVENVSTDRVPSDDVQAVLIQAVELDPFNEAAWTTWIARFGDSDGSVGASARALGVGVVEAHKELLVWRRKAALEWSTPEQCQESSIELEQLAGWVGYPFEAERARIGQLAADLDMARRTFQGVVHQTLEDADAARSSYDETQSRTVGDVKYDSSEDADNARAETRYDTIMSSTADDFFGWLTLAINRTFDYAGRSARAELWAYLGATLATALLILTAAMIVGGPLTGILAIIYLTYRASWPSKSGTGRSHEHLRPHLLRRQQSPRAPGAPALAAWSGLPALRFA